MSLGLEFDLTPIPPPSPCQVLTFGRGGGRYGETFTVDVDAALRDFEERVGLAGPKNTPTLANLPSRRSGDRAGRTLFSASAPREPAGC